MNKINCSVLSSRLSPPVLVLIREMSSVPFSVGSCSPNKVSNCTTKSALKEGTLTKSSRARIMNQHQKTGCAQVVTEVEANSNLIRRREAVGFSFCLGFAEAILQAKPSDAAEAAAPCEFTVAPSGLAFCDKVLGYGPEASKGQLIKAHYVGKLENGKVFDSSYNRGKPLTFRVGVGEVIKGWDQGILGGGGIPPMLTGGKRTLKLPPELGYGTRGAGCRGGSCLIPPDSVLLFDVEFVGKA